MITWLYIFQWKALLHVDSPEYIAQKERQEKKDEEEAGERKSRQQEAGTD